MKKPPSSKTERIVSLHLESKDIGVTSHSSTKEEYFRSMIMLDSKPNTKLDMICERTQCSKSVVIQYLLDTVEMTDIEQAIKSGALKPRRKGRAKKSFHT